MKNRGRVKFFALRYCDLTDLKKWVGSFLVCRILIHLCSDSLCSSAHSPFLPAAQPGPSGEANPKETTQPANLPPRYTSQISSRWATHKTILLSMQRISISLSKQIISSKSSHSHARPPLWQSGTMSYEPKKGDIQWQRLLSEARSRATHSHSHEIHMGSSYGGIQILDLSVISWGDSPHPWVVWPGTGYTLAGSSELPSISLSDSDMRSWGSSDLTISSWPHSRHDTLYMLTIYRHRIPREHRIFWTGRVLLVDRSVDTSGSMSDSSSASKQTASESSLMSDSPSDAQSESSRWV